MNVRIYLHTFKQHQRMVAYSLGTDVLHNSCALHVPILQRRLRTVPVVMQTDNDERWTMNDECAGFPSARHEITAPMSGFPLLFLWAICYLNKQPARLRCQHPLPRPSSPHKRPRSRSRIQTREVNHLRANEVSRLTASQLSLTFFILLKKRPRGPRCPPSMNLTQFRNKKDRGDTEGCRGGGILLLIALERSARVSKMSAFPLSHYCPATSATSCRRSELLSSSLSIQSFAWGPLKQCFT